MSTEQLQTEAGRKVFGNGSWNGTVPKAPESRQKPKSKLHCQLPHNYAAWPNMFFFPLPPPLVFCGSCAFYHKVSVCFGLWEFFVCYCWLLLTFAFLMIC